MNTYSDIDNDKKWEVTFIPGIWTHSTAVPVAFERNSAKVSSAMDKSLKEYRQKQTTKFPLAIKKVYNTSKEYDPTTTNQQQAFSFFTYPAGLASLGGCWGVTWCWPLVTTDSQLVSVVAMAAWKKKTLKSSNSVHKDEWNSKNGVSTQVSIYIFYIIIIIILCLLAEKAVLINQLRHLFL